MNAELHLEYKINIRNKHLICAIVCACLDTVLFLRQQLPLDIHSFKNWVQDIEMKELLALEGSINTSGIGHKRRYICYIYVYAIPIYRYK